MNKKQFITVGITLLIFIIIIAIILLTNNKSGWQKEILSSEQYEITMKDCKNRETKFPKETVKELFEKLNNISDNGPWTGDTKKCYSKVIISYEQESLVKEIEITIVDNSSVVINTGKDTRYYTNASEGIEYLNKLFQTY